jgi:predicted RNA-binding Zn ribbon-like protein
VVVAGALAVGGLVAVAVPAVAGTAGTDAVAAVVVGLAYVAVVVALALRFGVIPFHVWAGRLSQAAPEAALPLLLAWAPAGFALVALAWVQGAVVPSGTSLDVERAVAIAIGATTLILGTFAVWIQDDLEHVVGYATVQDAGFVVLGLAILGPEAWGPARTWVIVFGVAKTALAAWALALERAEGGRRIDDLVGWARRSPVLGLALAGIALATIGWPGSPAWDARSELLRLSMSEPLRWIVALGAFSSLAYYARLAWIGLRRSTGGMRPSASGPRPGTGITGRPSLRWSGPADVRRRLADAYARGSTVVARVGRSSGRPSSTGLREGWSRNRGSVATGLTVALTVVAVSAAAGWPNVPEAAAEAALTSTGAGGAPASANGAIALAAGEAAVGVTEWTPGQASGPSAHRSMSRR